MKKLDKTVKRETLYIALCTFVLSVLMESVFLIIGKYDAYVLFGNLLGAFAAVVNFLLMGVTVQNSLGREEKQIKNYIKRSQSLRLLMLFAVAAVGVISPYFNAVSTLLPLFFPRLSIALRPTIDKLRGNAE